jgi:thioredoxin reductase (NADPH)
LELTTTVENYPGFPEGINGPDLMEMMRKQAERFGTRFVRDNVVDVDFNSKPLKVKTQSQEYYAKAVIIATGASAMWLGLESEKRLTGKGVSSCATCDAPFFKNKDVIVVGGGDTAMEDSNFLTKFVNSVTIIHRRNEFRASKAMQDKVLSNPKIKVVWNSAVDEILGDIKVNGIRIKDVESGKTSEIKTDGVFVAIGHKPNTDFLKGKLTLDSKGYIVTKDEVETAIEGVFVAGDVMDPFYRQAATAASGGVKAALRVREYLGKI